MDHPGDGDNDGGCAPNESIPDYLDIAPYTRPAETAPKTRLSVRAGRGRRAAIGAAVIVLLIVFALWCALWVIGAMVGLQ